MAVFWAYLVTGLISTLPVIWMMLGSWMGVPIVVSEYFSLLGSLFLLVSAYLSLSFRRTAAIFALIGITGVCSFWVVEPIRAIRPAMSGVSIPLIALVVAIFGVCIGSGLFAIRDLRGHSAVLVSRRQRVSVFSISAACFLLIFGALYWQHKASERHASHYYIVDGYVGWVKIHFGVPGAQATPLHAGAYEFRIPQSGEYFTSTEQEFGWASDHYLYVNLAGMSREIPETGWGAGGMIWNNSSGTFEEEGKRPDRSEQFFVGTETQLHQLGEKGMEIEPGNLLNPETK